MGLMWMPEEMILPDIPVEYDPLMHDIFED